MLDEHGLRVVADGVERGNKVVTKNPVRSDGKSRSENKAWVRPRSVVYVVLVLDEHGFIVVGDCYLEHGNEVLS